MSDVRPLLVTTALLLGVACSRGETPSAGVNAADAAIVSVDAAPTPSAVIEAGVAEAAAAEPVEEAEGAPVPEIDRAPVNPQLGEIQIVGRFLNWRPLVIDNFGGPEDSPLSYLLRAPSGGRPSNLHVGDPVVVVYEHGGIEGDPPPGIPTVRRLKQAPTSLTVLEPFGDTTDGVELRPVTRPLSPHRRAGILAHYVHAGHHVDVAKEGTLHCHARGQSFSTRMAPAELAALEASLRAVAWPRRVPERASSDSLTFIDGSLRVLPFGAETSAAIVDTMNAVEARCLTSSELSLRYVRKQVPVAWKYGSIFDVAHPPKPSEAPSQRLPAELRAVSTEGLLVRDGSAEYVFYVGSCVKGEGTWECAGSKRLEAKDWPAELALRLGAVSASGTAIPPAEYAAHKAFYDSLPSSGDSAYRYYRDGDAIYTSPYLTARKR